MHLLLFLERIQIHHCTKTIDNNQGISHALRHSKGTSMRLAIEMVQKGGTKVV